jgi:hypothetical protein
MASPVRKFEVGVCEFSLDVVAFTHGLASLPHAKGSPEWLDAIRKAVGFDINPNAAASLAEAVAVAVDEFERSERWRVDLAYEMGINPWALEDWQAILLHGAKARREREAAQAVDLNIVVNHAGHSLSEWYDSAVRLFGEDWALDILSSDAMSERVRKEGAPPQVRGSRDPKTEVAP